MSRVFVGLGSCGLAAGGQAVLDALGEHLPALGIDAELSITGCIGLCYREVLVGLESPELGCCIYGELTPEVVPALLTTHFVDQKIDSKRLVLRDWIGGPEADVMFLQERVALRNCGRLNPESLDAYLDADGYKALERVLRELQPDDVITEIKRAGLRGRGGAGFPTGRKWELARASEATDRVVICNADEGDPGAFMDRNLLEGDPFSVIEGMTIAGVAIGATKGFVYVRDEYPLAIKRLDNAVALAKERGLLGKGIFDSDVDFELQLRRGAGAFVCGEETAMIASLEGRRGTPRRRPPFPVERGLWGRPTVINNVETFANVSWILHRGAASFRRMGMDLSRGTKVFALAGDVKRTGMIEAPMGLTIGEIVHLIGGGSSSNRKVKAVQIGGPAGGCIPAALFDLPVDYESLQQTGAIMGSGGLIVLDESACMVDIARYFLSFTQAESCGKCTPCRVGTKRMLEILDRICGGHGRDDDLPKLEQLARYVQQTSSCGLGRAAPNPVLTTLGYFHHEYQAHIEQKCCPAGKCRELIEFNIDAFRCDGCTLCHEQCSAGAIHKLGDRVIPLRIDPEPCTRCGGCFNVCQFGAVVVR